MRNLTFILLVLTAIITATIARADDAPALTLTVTQDQAKIADALGVLQQESGLTIVVDPTVIGRMGAAKVSFPTMPKMMDFLRSQEPGLTYAQLYIGQDRPTPSADDCFNLVRTLEWLGQQGNPMLVTPTTTVSVAQQSTPPAATPAGMKVIWYVSDEQIRQQAFLDAQKAAQQNAAAAAQAAAAATPQPSPSPYQYPQQHQPVMQQPRTYQVTPGLVIDR